MVHFHGLGAYAYVYLYVKYHIVTIVYLDMYTVYVSFQLRTINGSQLFRYFAATKLPGLNDEPCRVNRQTSEEASNIECSLL